MTSHNKLYRTLCFLDNHAEGNVRLSAYSLHDFITRMNNEISQEPDLEYQSPEEVHYALEELVEEKYLQRNVLGTYEPAKKVNESNNFEIIKNHLSSEFYRVSNSIYYEWSKDWKKSKCKNPI